MIVLSHRWILEQFVSMTFRKKIVIAGCLLGVVALLALDIVLAKHGVKIAERILAALILIVYSIFA